MAGKVVIPSRYRLRWKRIDLLLPWDMVDAVDNFRASRRPIPNEGDALRELIEMSLRAAGFPMDRGPD